MRGHNGAVTSKTLWELQLLLPRSKRSSVGIQIQVSKKLQKILITDARLKGFFLMQSPLLMTIILTGYLLMIKHGPKLMESRKAFELKFVLMVYNFAQVVLNLALGIYVLRYSHCKPASVGVKYLTSDISGRISSNFCSKLQLRVSASWLFDDERWDYRT